MVERLRCGRWENLLSCSDESGHEGCAGCPGAASIEPTEGSGPKRITASPTERDIGSEVNARRWLPRTLRSRGSRFFRASHLFLSKVVRNLSQEMRRCGNKARTAALFVCRILVGRQERR